MISSNYNEDEETDESLRPKPAKRIKLEHDADSATSSTAVESVDSEVTKSIADRSSAIAQHQQSSQISSSSSTTQKFYSKQDLIDYFEKEFSKRREAYVDRLLELFFLEDGGNLPEYYTWRKKTPTNALLQYFKLVAKDNESEFESLQYEKAKLDLVNSNAVRIIPLSQLKPLNETQASSQQQQLALDQQQPVAITSLTGSTGSLSQQQQLQNQSTFISSSSTSTSLSSTVTPINNNANSSLTHPQNASQFTTPSAVSSKSNVNNQLQSSSKTVISSPFSTPTFYHHNSSQSTNKFTHLNSSSQFSKSLPTTPIAHKKTRFPNISKQPITPVAVNISSVYESSIGSKEQIVERVKQEAQIMGRIAELRKEGLWSAKRLPRLQEPAREKAHWDYLLEEMTWLATDFAQERKWKKAAAKKCARMIMKYHGDKESQAEKAEKENLNNLRKIASKISKEVRQFWSSVEKLVDFKMQTKLEEKRKKALDLHLNFIVGQTEKYSSWLAEGLNNKNPSSEPLEDEENNSNDNENETGDDRMDIDRLEKNDQEFNLSDDQDESDVEDTIAEQERNENKQENAQELDELKNEAEMPIEELLKRYSELENKSEIADESMEDEEYEDETEDPEEEDEQSNEGEDQSNEDKGEKEEIGVEYLLNLESETSDKTSTDPKSGPTIKITDIAAGAQSIQPKGNTLSTAQVQIKVPFLLKGQLREYQLIGLDWLVQMYLKNLNGVLADEMGLGKTIQTIALLAHLACEKGIWGPHLVVVPTSVILNWEMEFKKWCPAFKVLTYYGSPKERKLKRQGWTKPNQFHICITSYKLVVQDHNSFRRKKWCYLILDEAQHIKNFKSQRWQMLLNFNTSRRLLLTGTPLQNNLMELWSLMHFLMPNVFSSHRDFKDWFVNPVTGMIEGNKEFNQELILRLHKVLRPFLLRRVKVDVEKQLPKKYEHVLSCRLSKRQRFLYEEFMNLTKTKETLETGNFLSVINVLMQLRKVCNHPNLFETRSVQSPFSMRSITYSTASLCITPIDYNPFQNVDLNSLSGNLVELCSSYSASDIHRINSLQVPSRLIEEIDHIQFDSPPKVPIVKFNNQKQINNFRSSVPHSLRIRNNLQQNTINSPTETDELKKYNNFKSQISKSNNHHLTDHDGMLRNACGKQLSTVEQRKDEERKEKLKLLARINKMKCNRHSLYTKDLLNVVDIQSDPKRITTKSTTNFNIGQGYFNCLHNQNRQRKAVDYEHYSNALSSILRTPDELISQLNTEIDRFTFVVPSVSAPKIKIHIPHQSPSKRNFDEYFENTLHYELLKRSQCLHKIVSNMANQFPELRLIQYDCGKLQTLDKLLWELRAGGHRVLIFTQMSRMLDIFEQFLNYHGHTYLRLDGSTKIDQRQALMERFNADKRIFCFILSTRSGGVGVNLTGADTVIFYDSDWNPTLDLQAQDRCHRIGQTRDVHIYRLVSEKTVEENILKKARQKQFLNDIAIEGGNFTTAFFKNDTIKELFNVNATNLAESSVQSLLQPSKVLIEEVEQDEKTTKLNTQLGQALHAVEEESDVVAAKTAIAEASAEFAEFDESIPLDVDRNDEKSPEEEELDRVVSELLPIERYAMQFLETIQEPIQAEQLKQAEEEIEAQKKEWELGHLKSLKEEENERALKQQEQDEILTMNKEDVAQIYVSKISEEIMPTWAPPTPPQDENDFYYDYSLAFMYDSEIMTESQLPPVYVPKEPKRIRLENITGRKQPKRKDENIHIPRSLFDKPTPCLLKLRKEVKAQKNRGLITGGPDTNQLHRIISNLGANFNLPPPHTLQQQAALSKTPSLILHGTQQESQIHWGINEDWSLVEIIQHVQELPINLIVLSPGHIPNWDFVSSHVNSKTSTYRSPKLCRHHYETVILPKEEGRSNEQPSTKKLKKLQKQAAIQAANQQNQPNNTDQNGATANKPQIRPVKTSNLFAQDNNTSFTQLMNSRFNNILQIANKRQPTLKPVFVNQHGKNPKHLMLLQDSNINYEQPLLPTLVAQHRADRIAREAQANKVKAEQAARQRMMQIQQQQQQQQQQKQQQQIIQCQTPIKNVVSVQNSNVVTNANIQPHQQPTITQVVPANTINTTQQTTHSQAKINPVINQNSITVSRGNVPQFVATPTNISSLSANQQISNLAKALSQAAANFQPTQNATIQVQSTVQPQQTATNQQIVQQTSSVPNVIQAQSPRLNTANIQINQTGSPKLVAQATTPVSITQSTQQTSNLTSGTTSAGTVNVLSAVTSIPQQKIITATFTNPNTRPVAQLHALKTHFMLRPTANLANKQAVASTQQITTSGVQQTGAIQAQLTTQPTTGQIALPISSAQQQTSTPHRVQIAASTGNLISTQSATFQQQTSAAGCTTVGQQIVNTQQQQTPTISAQNIVRPNTSVGPTIIATSNALPIVPISSATGIGQIVQARTTLQQPPQQIHIASLTKPPGSATVMTSTGLPSMTVPIGAQLGTTNQTRSVFARRATDEEVEHILSNRNAAQKAQQQKIIASAPVVQQQTTAVSTPTTSQQGTSSGSISLQPMTSIQFLQIQSPSTTNVQTQQINREAQGTTTPQTHYLIFNSSKGNTK